MTNKQAFDIVTAASLEYRGTRAQHETIAQALSVLEKLVSASVNPVATVPDNVVDIKSQ